MKKLASAPRYENIPDSTKLYLWIITPSNNTITFCNALGAHPLLWAGFPRVDV